MLYMVLADGTVPVVVAKVEVTDLDLNDEESLDSLHCIEEGEVRFGEVPDDTAWLGISWFDGEGFTLLGWNAEEQDEALSWFGMDGTGPEWEQRSGTTFVSTEPLHMACTLFEGDDAREGYLHLIHVAA